ncbi:hypothetical protein [Ponticaulis sp.]|uniref:hypothetical protein n=1 Tax=Ponticaulis sp. TaxID=2020902 RepID=UPI0025ED7840|nr:hypothetical protein [Ponticaulis sp.]|tara:strand:- start:64496 stop:64651 length:156 start_codon:yes stop_codon:yes gene_type:complete
MQFLYEGQLAGEMGETETANTLLDQAESLFQTAGPAAARYIAKVEQVRTAL